MAIRCLSILLIWLFTGCGGEEKHFPSSNPPGYDPNKVYTAPAPVSPPVSQSSAVPSPKSEPLSATTSRACERRPTKQSEREELPAMCGGGLGTSEGGGSGGAAEGGRKSADAGKRPSYVLEFQSMILLTDPNSEPAQSQASAIIHLEAQAEQQQPGVEPKYTGDGYIVYRTGPLPNWEPCTALVRGEGKVPFRVFQAFIHRDRHKNTSAPPNGGEAKIELLYGLLGASQETSTGMPFMLEHRCVPNKPVWHPFWSTRYISGRAEIGSMPEQMFLLKDWTYVGQNGVVATITLQSTCGGMCDREVSVFTLKEADTLEATPQ